ARHLAYPRRDRARRRPRGHPPRRPPARRARARIWRLGAAHQHARARSVRSRAGLPRSGLGRAMRDRGATVGQGPYDLDRGWSGRVHRGGVGRRRRRGWLRPLRHDPGAPRSGGPLSLAHERVGRDGVKHFATLLLKEERAIFSSPIAYATVAVYLILM